MFSSGPGDNSATDCQRFYPERSGCFSTSLAAELKSFAGHDFPATVFRIWMVAFEFGIGTCRACRVNKVHLDSGCQCSSPSPFPLPVQRTYEIMGAGFSSRRVLDELIVNVLLNLSRENVARYPGWAASFVTRSQHLRCFNLNTIPT